MDAEASDRKKKRDPDDLTTAGPPGGRRGAAAQTPEGPMIAGRYEVLEQLGEGGMGVVFKVRDHRMGGRLIALKRILQLDDRARARFESEIHSAANLNHRNICKVHDAGEDDDGPFFTMELLNGGSLADRVSEQGPMAHEALVDLARQLAQALRYAHRKSVQHRDVKPTNVLFAAEDGDPKLADFGIARFGPASAFSVTNVGLGTPGFSAPEQLVNAKAADHRADIYSLGATLYYALTGHVPSGDDDLSGLPPFWQTLIGKCMKEDATERYFDAGEVIEHLERTAEGSGADLADQCNVCGADNPTGSGFCRQCGAGLSEPCPECGGLNRPGQQLCRHCGIDIAQRWAAERRLRDARDHLELREYHRAERAAGEVLKRDPQRADARQVQDDARQMVRRLEALRDSAIQLESEKRYREAEQAWHRVLDIQPDHRQALDAIERLRGSALDERFLEKAGEFRSAIERRALPKATRLLHELRTIAAPAAASQIPQYDQALETLRRMLILDLKETFDTALQRRRRKTARAVIGKLSELQVDPAEVTAMLERLKACDRGWQRLRTARRLVGGVLLLAVAGFGYLLVADQYNRKIADDAAAVLARGEEPALEGFLPTWPRDERAVLRERSRLCRTLDGRYGSDQWRGAIEDVGLFGGRHHGWELVTAYNWLVLRQVADAARAGSDDDLDRARDLVRKVAWKELGPRGEGFRNRQETLREILGGWYDGSLSLDVFADAGLVGRPELEFVSEQAARITDPQTDCDTIARLTRVLGRLDQGEHIADQVRAHNERVVEALGEAVDDPRSSRIANLLNHLCLETDDPQRAEQDAGRAIDRLVGDLRLLVTADPQQRANVIALLAAIDRGLPDVQPAELRPVVEELVREQTAELLPLIEDAFESGGDVAALLARLNEQRAGWSYLGDAAAERLAERGRRLQELHERWPGGPLPVAPLCELDRVEPIDRLWLEFEQGTESLALDAFYGENPQRAARLAALLGELDYGTEALRDLSSRLRIHDTLLRLADALPAAAHAELRRRLFSREPPARQAAPSLATDVVLAAIESGRYEAAQGLAPIADAPELADIARHVGQLADLPEATLRELEASVLADARLPETSRLVRGEVEHRLTLCLPESTTLQSPGQLSLVAAHEVSRVSLQPRGGALVDLDPLGDGDVYRIPFLETGPVTLTVRDPFGVTTSRPFNVVHSMLRNPAEVTLRSQRVVQGEPAVLAIRPRLAFDRVTVEGVDRTGELADQGDHWVLELATSLEPGQPAANRQWNLRLVTREGVQKLELPLVVVARQIVEAEAALQGGRYEEVFDLLGGFTRRDHDVLRRLEHEAGARWIEQLQASEPGSSAEADALLSECGRFLAKVPEALHQDAAAIRDGARISRIEMTSTWESADALRADLAFLQGLEEKGQRQRAMIAWLEGAAQWVDPIVERMQRLPGDWSTVRDRTDGTFPAVLVHRGTGLEFVYVPAGSFGIGGNSRSPQETPHRSVTVSGFYLSRNECTRAAWAAGSGEAPPPEDEARLPVTGVAFVEAAAWCSGLGLDLPTEAQWELAAAGVGGLEYPWGDGKCHPNVKRAFRSSELAEVGAFECDRSPYDALDMAGNVREWCYPVSNATYRILPEGAEDPPALPDGVIVRGASWQHWLKEGRTHHRVFTPGSPTEVGAADPTVGFRPVLVR